MDGLRNKSWNGNHCPSWSFCSSGLRIKWQQEHLCTPGFMGIPLEHLLCAVLRIKDMQWEMQHMTS